jgi:hypothetical protein
VHKIAGTTLRNILTEHAGHSGTAPSGIMARDVGELYHPRLQPAELVPFLILQVPAALPSRLNYLKMPNKGKVPFLSRRTNSRRHQITGSPCNSHIF